MLMIRQMYLCRVRGTEWLVHVTDGSMIRSREVLIRRLG